MANILNCHAIFSQIWKQQKADAKAFVSRGLKIQSIDELLESTKSEKKLKEAISLRVYKKNIFVI